jgi:hypothetical protein
MNGHLHRFGTTMRKEIIDVRALPKALPQPGSTGRLRVNSPVGCIVKVGTDMLSGNPPVSTSIEAGREMEVIVSCPGQPVWSRWVMAVPGLDVDISMSATN